MSNLRKIKRVLMKNVLHSRKINKRFRKLHNVDDLFKYKVCTEAIIETTDDKD